MLPVNVLSSTSLSDSLMSSVRSTVSVNFSSSTSFFSRLTDRLGASAFSFLVRFLFCESYKEKKLHGLQFLGQVPYNFKSEICFQSFAQIKNWIGVTFKPMNVKTDFLTFFVILELRFPDNGNIAINVEVQSKIVLYEAL